jgi:autotransporter-associated beta strand protein
MKMKYVNMNVMMVVLALAVAPAALAVNYTWDASGSAPLDDGGGTWTASGGSNWYDGSAYGAWGNTTGDAAIIGSGSGAAGTIGVIGTITLNTLTLNASGAGNYIISGGILSFGGAAPAINVNQSATIENGTTNYVTVAAGVDLAINGTAGQVLTMRKLTVADQNSSVIVNGGTLALKFERWNPFLANVNGSGSSTLYITNNGTVKLVENYHTISDNARVDIAAGSTFDINTKVEGIGYLSGAGNVINMGGYGGYNQGLALDTPSFYNGADFSGTISGSGGITLRGNSAGSAQKIQILSGANTYAGATYIDNKGGNYSAGLQLQLANPSGAALQGNVIIGGNANGTQGAVLSTMQPNQFGPNSVVTMNNATAGVGYFLLNGNDQTIAGLSSLGTNANMVVQNSEAAAAGAATLTISNNTSHIFCGQIRRTQVGGANVGHLNIVKTGTGRQTFVANQILKNGADTTANAYSGNVSVVQGTLKLQDTASSYDARITTVASGATLEFNAAAARTHLDNVQTLTGAGRIVKSGASEMWLGTRYGGANIVYISQSAGGLIDVQEGTLQNYWSAGNWSVNQGSLNVANSACFNLWDANATVDALTGSGTVDIGAGAYANQTLIIGAGNHTSSTDNPYFSGNTATFSGIISNTLGVINLTKTGTGTQIFAGNNTFTGNVRVEDGTMKLGVDNTFSDSSVLVMAGGTLDAGTFTDTMASLNLVSDSTLELGTGHLTFGNSTGYTWSGTLELTGTLGDTTLRFVPNLTSDQLARISYYGNSVSSTPDGYIISRQGPIILLQ